MIVVLGGYGYIGEAFCAELERRGQEYMSLSRKKADYSRFDVLLEFLRETRPSFVVNAAGYTGKPNVDACEDARAETLEGNTLLPQTIAQACYATNTPWGHVSSGCIYQGAKVRDSDGSTRIEPDLIRFFGGTGLKEVQGEKCKVQGGEGGWVCEVNNREVDLIGLNEADEPNFSFRNPPCSFYSGTKALGEEAILKVYGGDGVEGLVSSVEGREARGQRAPVYIWRLRIPFDEHDNPRNYLRKLLKYPRLYENFNSVSHRRDFVGACIDLWQKWAPSGIYNVTNPGFVTTRGVVEMMRQVLGLDRYFEFWESDEAFYAAAAKSPRSNCILDVSKLEKTGVAMRPVEEALIDALRNWRNKEVLPVSGK